MSGHRSAFVAALTFALRIAALDATPATQPEMPRLAVTVNDYAGAPLAVLEDAKSHVSFIYRVAGVELVWIDRDDPRLRDPELLKSIVTVSLYSEEMTNRPRTGGGRRQSVIRRPNGEGAVSSARGHPGRSPRRIGIPARQRH